MTAQLFGFLNNYELYNKMHKKDSCRSTNKATGKSTLCTLHMCTLQIPNWYLTNSNITQSTNIITHYVKHDVIHKTRSTQHIPLSSQQYIATVTGNAYRKFCGVWTCGSWDMRTDRQQMYRQTDIETRWSPFFILLPDQEAELLHVHV